MKQSVGAFALFIAAQFLFLFVSERNNIVTGLEMVFPTIIVGVFIALFFAGYRWARWVAATLLALLSLLAGNMTLEGFGVGFLSVSFLYGAVIVLLFRHSAVWRKKQPARPVGLESEVIDWFPTAGNGPSVGSSFQAGEKIYRYPFLVRRYQSLLIDFLLLFTIMITTMVIMEGSLIRQTVMVSMGLIFSLLYEPILTAYAATLGQYIIGIRVRDARNPDKRINILQAYLRIIVKWLLGWLSFVTINFNPQHRAIHDLAGSSVVIRVK